MQSFIPHVVDCVLCDVDFPKMLLQSKKCDTGLAAPRLSMAAEEMLCNSAGWLTIVWMGGGIEFFKTSRGFQNLG